MPAARHRGAGPRRRRVVVGILSPHRRKLLEREEPARDAAAGVRPVRGVFHPGPARRRRARAQPRVPCAVGRPDREPTAAACEGSDRCRPRAGGPLQLRQERPQTDPELPRGLPGACRGPEAADPVAQLQPLPPAAHAGRAGARGRHRQRRPPRRRGGGGPHHRHRRRPRRQRPGARPGRLRRPEHRPRAAQRDLQRAQRAPPARRPGAHHCRPDLRCRARHPGRLLRALRGGPGPPRSGLHRGRAAHRQGLPRQLRAGRRAGIARHHAAGARRAGDAAAAARGRALRRAAPGAHARRADARGARQPRLPEGARGRGRGAGTRARGGGQAAPAARLLAAVGAGFRDRAGGGLGGHASVGQRARGRDHRPRRPGQGSGGRSAGPYRAAERGHGAGAGPGGRVARSASQGERGAVPGRGCTPGRAGPAVAPRERLQPAAAAGQAAAGHAVRTVAAACGGGIKAGPDAGRARRTGAAVPAPAAAGRPADQ